MLNTLAISVWAILVTLGVFYLQQPASKHAEVEKPPEVISKDYRSGTISTAVFRAGTIIGHFVTTVRFQLPEEDYKKLQVPIEFLIGDQLFSVLNAMNIEELKTLKTEHHHKVAQKLEEALHNIKLPAKNVSFESIEVLSK